MTWAPIGEMCATPLQKTVPCKAGSEVSLALEVAKKLDDKKIRVVSMPCWELFDLQSDKYKNELIPARGNLKVSIEAGITHGWEKYIGRYGLSIGIDHFGSSAPASDLAEEFGFTPEEMFKVDENKKKDIDIELDNLYDEPS